MITGIILKISLGIIILLVLIRFMGRKELSQASPLYYLYAMLIAGIVEESIYDEKVTLLEMGIAFAVAVILFVFIEKITYHFPGLEQIIKGQPILLIIDGRINHRAKRKEGLTEQDIETLLREQNIFDLREVDAAYLENNGTLTVKRKKAEA